MNHKIKLTVVAALMLLASNNAGAIPIYYFYEGEPFTENEFWQAGSKIKLPQEEQPAGLTLQDRVTATLVFDSAGWGFSEWANNPFILSTSFAIGPWVGSWEVFRFITDEYGTVLNWGFYSIVGPRFDLASGSGSDVIFGNGFGDGSIHGSAFVSYPPGSPSRWSTGTVSPVPDSGMTLAMLAAGLLGLGVFGLILNKREAATTLNP